MKHNHIDDPDLPLGALMTQWPDTIPVFMRHKMLCVGCLVNPFHTVIDACAEYGLDVDAFYAELAESIKPSRRTE
jgi:hybrid cluster-associated redox disulfide protein